MDREKDRIVSYPLSGVTAEILEVIATTRKGLTRILKIKMNEEVYVMKEMKKVLFKSEGSIKHAFSEKQILGIVDHKLMSKLVTTCQDSECLCLIMTLVEGAPLNKILQMNGKFTLELTRQLICQTIDLLDHLHSLGILYRDLKATNLLIDTEGIIKLIDFGLSKVINDERTHSIAGTPHSSPPDIFNENGYGYAIDYFSLGILTFELLFGKPPLGFLNSFDEIKDTYTEENITNRLNSVQWPSPDSKDFVTQLLSPNEETRLGSNGGFSQIKSHSFFNNFELLKTPKPLMTENMVEDIEFCTVKLEIEETMPDIEF